MQQIIPQIRLVQKILGEQKTDAGLSYRISTYCMRIEQPEGLLLYHTLTGEILLLAPGEAVLLEKFPGPIPAALTELASHRFLVPEKADDMAVADQVRRIAERFGKEATALVNYKIFTTMECNARCFYCYEGGWGKSTMTEQTALDTAKYIAAHCGGKPVRLGWFGGEPLVNAKVIDVITDSLRQQGVEFHSKMTSNGYLFDHALVQRAKGIWNLQRVQVTLDGTEEVYNKRKAYVHPEGSPYQRVLRNIELLLETGIGVNVRLNMDGDNEKDLYILVDELAERFGGKPGFGVHLLDIKGYNAGIESPSGIEEVRRSYAEKLRSLQAYVEKKGISARVSLDRGVVINSCRADSGSCTTVMPDGRLGRCDGCEDGGIWGSIYSDDVDKEVLRQWRERLPAEEVCRTCVIYPKCIRLKKCPGVEKCSLLGRLYDEERLRRAVLAAYADWKTAGSDGGAA